MKCEHCQRELKPGDRRCPSCGALQSECGVFQTSLVMISSHGAASVYRDVSAVPAPLRRALEKSTNGANSATILIADSGGRREIANALKDFRRRDHARLAESLLSTRAPARRWQVREWVDRQRQNLPLWVGGSVAFLMALAAICNALL